MLWKARCDGGDIGVRRTSIGSKFAVVIGEVIMWDGVVRQNPGERAQAKDDDGLQHLVGSKRILLLNVESTMSYWSFQRLTDMATLLIHRVWTT